jgi:hypothetical protein
MSIRRAAGRIGLRWEAPRAPDGRRRQICRYNFARQTRTGFGRFVLLLKPLSVGYQTTVDEQMRKIPGVRGWPPTILKHTPVRIPLNYF